MVDEHYHHVCARILPEGPPWFLGFLANWETLYLGALKSGCLVSLVAYAAINLDTQGSLNTEIM
jgi:hypothetical protein